MKGDNAADLPIADDGIDNRVQVLAEHPSATKRNVISDEAVESLRDIVVAISVIGMSVVCVLPVVVVAATLAVAAVVADGVRQAMRPSVISLKFQAIAQRFGKLTCRAL